ncbi:hypothetical protein [Aliikangiella marina]|nr:hypothetical protein [Aliikangiella marina]
MESVFSDFDSMEEFIHASEKLEKLGYWRYDVESETLSWSAMAQ